MLIATNFLLTSARNQYRLLWVILMVTTTCIAKSVLSVKTFMAETCFSTSMVYPQKSILLRLLTIISFTSSTGHTNLSQNILLPFHTSHYSWMSLLAAFIPCSSFILVTVFRSSLFAWQTLLWNSVCLGMDLTTDKLRSLVKKWQTLIQTFVDIKTSDGYTLRVFCIGFTKKQKNSVRKTAYAQTSQIKAIRAKMRDVIQNESTNCDLKQFVGRLITDEISREIEKSVKVSTLRVFSFWKWVNGWIPVSSEYRLHPTWIVLSILVSTSLFSNGNGLR